MAAWSVAEQWEANVSHVLSTITVGIGYVSDLFKPGSLI